MSLPILVVFVAIGIALTVAAVHFTGGSKSASISDDEHARQIFFADFPDERPGNVDLTLDRHSAFMPLKGGRTGIVQSLGDGFFTRIVSSADIATVRVREPAIVSIRFRDFTWTGGNFAFADRDTATRIYAALSPEKA